MKITFEEFEQEFEPLQNHIDSNASFDGYMYETYGAELDYILEQNKDYVWTIVEEDNEFFVIPNYHLVNRVGYIITNISHNQANITVYDI